ncbi:hypothetical protein GLYMA_07G094900v4 [Glycine max]|uniref:Uncharacterized protein n=1 Tax=Glycine max TaxID=3847 RepID=K7L0M5_SOYBN|nr:hypothetical protein GLYMA_07G094900v4 [Glycine max]
MNTSSCSYFINAYIIKVGSQNFSISPTMMIAPRISASFSDFHPLPISTVHNITMFYDCDPRFFIGQLTILGVRLFSTLMETCSRSGFQQWGFLCTCSHFLGCFS